MSNPVYMLDTNTVSYMLKQKSQALRDTWEAAELISRIVISTVTAAELHYGLEKNPSAVLYREAVEGLLNKIEVLPWDIPAAKAYGVLRQQLQASGRTLETHDLMIAAHAQSLPAVLVTRDKVFRYLAGYVQVVNWATDLN